MGVNVDKMKEERARRNSGGDMWDVPEGDIAIYVAPPLHEDDDVPYWEYKIHWGLGKKGKLSAVCLDTTYQPILLNKHLIKQLKKMGKEKALKGSCPVCDALDKGELNDDDSKGQSRWLWIVMPMKSRTSAKESFTPWNKTDDLQAFGTGYRMWDSMSDKFGEGGDLTDPDKAQLIRVIREGKGLKTKWDAQADVESVRKPLKLSKSARVAIAEGIKEGGKCDPYRIIAALIKKREDTEKLIKEALGAESDDYEDGDGDGDSESTVADEGKHAPPGKAATKAETKAETKAASKPAGKGATKAKTGKDGAIDIKKLTKERGGPPPSCFKIDPDSEEEICQKCPWKQECADHVGVPVPPDFVEAEADGGDGDGGGDRKGPGGVIAAKDCEAGTTYFMTDGTPAEYKGPAKGKHYFLKEGEKKPIKLEDDDEVGVISADGEASDGDDGDDELAKLEAELQAGNKKKGAKPARSKA